VPRARVPSRAGVRDRRRRARSARRFRDALAQTTVPARHHTRNRRACRTLGSCSTGADDVAAALGRDGGARRPHRRAGHPRAAACRRERDARTLAPHEYAETQTALVAEDKARYGDDGGSWKRCSRRADRCSRPADRVLAHCGLRWDNTLELAGLERRQPKTKPTQQARHPGGAVSGMSAVEVIAFYAALRALGRRTRPCSRSPRAAASAQVRPRPRAPMSSSRSRTSRARRSPGLPRGAQHARWSYGNWTIVTKQ
jgi:hypothetical protein